MSKPNFASKKVVRGFVVAAFGLALAGAASAALTLKITPAATTVSVGQQFSVDLIADGASAGIGAWDFVLQFSTPGLVSASNVSFSNALGVIGTEAISFTGSDFGVVSLLPTAQLIALQQNQPLNLATVTFNAVALGTTQVSLGAPQFGQMLVDAAGQAITPIVTAASVTVVPEPTSVAMWLAGLGLLVGCVRRNRARPQ